MTEHTITKRDLYRVARAFQHEHLGQVFQELTEIFEENVEYTLHNLLELCGDIVYRDNPPIYISKKEYDAMTPAYREKRNMPLVGNRYEFIPRRIFKYESYITPLFYGSIVCRGVRSKKIIRMVTEKIFNEERGFFELFKVLPSWSKCTENEKQTATYLFNYYLRMKMGME